MAELHDSLVRTFKKGILRRGFKDGRCGMPDYRPDLFLEKVRRNGSPAEQIVVEAEIPSTLFSEHTEHQLSLLHDFVRHQDAKDIKVRAYLLIPKGKSLRRQARSLLTSYFSDGTRINVVQP